MMLNLNELSHIQALFPELTVSEFECVYLHAMGLPRKSAVNEVQISQHTYKARLSSAALRISDGSVTQLRAVVQVRLFTALITKINNLPAPLTFTDAELFPLDLD